MIGRLVHDCLTGPDGVTFAFGRCAAAALLVGHPLAVTVYAGLTFQAHAPSWNEAAAFVGAVAGTYALLVAAAERLVRLTNSIEPPAD